jgi:PAS domain S-box-containing protein
LRFVGGDEQLDVVIDAVPAAIAYVDREQRFRMVNAHYRAAYGDARGKLASEVFGELYPQLRGYVERALAGEQVTYEFHAAGPDGVEHWLQLHYTPDIAGGNVRGFTVLVHDISAYKEAEQRMALLGEASTALAASVDQDGVAQTIVDTVVPVLADWAALYVDRFGVLVPKVIAHRETLGHDDMWQLARSFMPQPAAAAVVEGNCLVVPLIARSKRLGVLVLGTVTPRKWPVEDLLLAEELGRRASTSLDVTRLFEQQRRANERLQEADRRKDEFLAIVGHELRNPLAPIVTALDVMEYRGLAGCERERAVIRRQALHMSRLVEDLLDVARIRRGKFVLHKQPLELHTVIAKAIEQTSPLLEQRNQQLTVDVPRELVIEADATRMTQVFGNLLTNAAKYTQARGHIAITAARDGETIAITVSDDGPGIAPELLADIFDPFVQGERTLQRAEGGLGLGLSLVRSLTELHGGSATAANDGPGRGARFTIELPAYQLITAPPAAAPAHAGARLLLVDDNADAARVLAELLREHGYDVAVAHDAPAALVLADEFRPAIALLDIGLPVMDGYELARHLRTRLPAPLRLVAVTGYGGHPDSARNHEAGFDVHLGKPVDFEKLVSVLGSLSPS